MSGEGWMEVEEEDLSCPPVGQHTVVTDVFFEASPESDECSPRETLFQPEVTSGGRQRAWLGRDFLHFSLHANVFSFWGPTACSVLKGNHSED